MRNLVREPAIFFTNVFLKYNVMAQHPLDSDASKEVFDVPLKGPLPKTITTYPIADRDKEKLKNLLDYSEVCNYNTYIQSEISVFMQSILSVLKDKVAKSRCQY